MNKSLQVETGANNPSEVHCDPTFDLSDSTNCHLAIEFGFTGIKAVILDLRSSKYVAVMVHQFPQLLTWKALDEKLSGLLTDTDLLNRSYRSVSAGLITKEHTLIPTGLFEPGHENKYLGFTHEIEEEVTTHHDDLMLANAKNIYSMPETTKGIITKAFPNVKLVHASSVLIESCLKEYREVKGNVVVLNVRQSTFDQIIVSGSKLQFVNTFEYQTPEDIAYYTLHTCEQLKLKKDETRFRIMGTSEYYEKCAKFLRDYMKDLSTCSRTSDYAYASIFSSFKEYELVTLVTQYACA